MRVYIASLSDYNNGRLEGKWFDLSDYLSASDLMDDINDMLNDLTKKYKNVDGEVREEWAVHDYEGIPPTLASEYMGEADFDKLLEIRKVAEDRDIPVEVLVERAGDTGSDDYEALADSLVMVVDGSDETDIVYELEDQLGELGNDFWKEYIFIDDVTERVIYGEDVDRYREDILYENPDMDEEEAERQAEEMADEEADRRRDLSTYLEEMGYGDEIPNFVSKDYNDAWKHALSYDYDVIHHDGEMYVFTNNYSLGGTILSGLVGAYIGYKLGRNAGSYREGEKTFDFERAVGKHVGKKVKGSLSKKKYAGGGKIGFKGLSSKVAKRYAGKKVAPKYQGEYGKRYSKSEAKEVGNKVAGKVYQQQQGRKMAMGGGLAQYPNDLPKAEAERLFHLAHKNAKVGDRIWNNFKRTPLRLIYANLDERGIKYSRGGNVNTGRSWHLDRARHNKGETYETPLNNRKRKYEDGGQIGQEIVFDDNGEENTGVIKDITNLGDYVVKADDGRTLLAQRDLDVISLGAMRSASTEAPRKRFGFFEDGGSVIGNQNKRFLDSLDISYKQRVLRNIANHYGISIVEAEEEVTDSESENLYEYITDTSLRMKVYNDMKNRRYAQGGKIVVYAENEEGYYRKISEHDTMRGAKTKMNNLWQTNEYYGVGAVPIDVWEKRYAPYQFKEGGGVYSSDDLYELLVFDVETGVFLGIERFRAKNIREAQEMGQEYEDKYKKKYRENLRFKVQLAPTMFQEKGGLMANGGGVSGLDDLIRG
jgi:antirestriction protein